MVRTTYAGLRMEANETVSAYFQHFKSSMSVVTEAHMHFGNGTVSKWNTTYNDLVYDIYL